MRVSDLLLATGLIFLSLIMTYALITSGTLPLAPQELTSLASYFLFHSFNSESPLWAGSPEVVSAILWDYRGIDTVYETVVFFLAIIGSVALLRGVKLLPETAGSGKGLTVVAKTVTKITFATIPIIAFSIAVHGHLTPGGGFQAGSTFAVAPLLMIAAMSLRVLVGRGWSKERLLAIRSAGLILIVITAVAVLLASLYLGVRGYILQNMPKPYAVLGMPLQVPLLATVALFSGSIFWLNLFEFIAVSAGLSLVFVLLTVPTKVMDSEVRS